MGITTSDGQYFEDMFDYQTAFSGKVTDPIPDTSKFKQQASQVPQKDLNSPAASVGGWRGTLGDIMSVRIDDIPEGVSARDYLKQLQQQTAAQYGAPKVSGHGNPNAMEERMVALDRRDYTPEEFKQRYSDTRFDKENQSRSIEDRRGLLNRLDSTIFGLTGRTLFPEDYGDEEKNKNWHKLIKDVQLEKVTPLSQDAGVLDIGVKETFDKLRRDADKLRRTKTFEEAHSMSDEEFDKWFADGGILSDK